jgi:phospholipid transport system substrate-binding protein
MPFCRRVFVVLLTSLPLLAPSVVSLAAPEAGADALIRSLGGDAIRLLSDKTLDPPRRESEFRRLLVQSFDVDVISRFVLGRFWRQATDQQKAEFRQLFEDYVVKAYATRLSQYSGETLSIKETRPSEEGEVMVASQIDRPNGPPVRIDWRCRAEGGNYKITDVVVEGISMAITQRQEFGSVIQNSGGNVQALIDQLRAKTAQIK